MDTSFSSPIGDRKHVFIIGAKSIGQYGGFETFLDKLTEQHQYNKHIQYYIVTKANGKGCMDETKLNNIVQIGENAFLYHGAKVVKLQIPQFGPAQAVLFDIKALRFCLKFIEEKHIQSPIIYILACRLGPFFNSLVKQAHQLNGVVYVNPDGHEWKRAKWSAPVRRYWKKSEKNMVKHADLLVCDSRNIERYIRSEYSQYKPETIYIAYGSELNPSPLKDDDLKWTEWLKEKDLKAGQYYMCCGRFVPENSFEIMIREYMKSHTSRSFVIITTKNDKYLNAINKQLHFSSDPRVRFVGTVYNNELLKKIRENAYANLHGHTVGGTNPSLLEALASTDINLLIDVGFNREVAEDAALYWTKEEGNLAALIDKAEQMSSDQRTDMAEKARKRISEHYSWQYIGNEYEKLWMR